MKKRKFIERIQEMFGIIEPETSSKKEAILDLVRKLKAKRAELKLQLRLTKDEAEIADIKESLMILKKQVAKGEKLLDA
ncbi:MAG: hypothetical protein IBX45_06090 [Campylobacterales bacterium]|nr:hypothetical protein [Campylobacterales bacterium]